MKAKKSLGQNFLKDEDVLQRINDEIDAKDDDLIIEIGPGMGALTKYLKNKNSKLICYEIDTDLKPYLNKYEDNNTKIIYKDILMSNIKEDIKDISYNNLFIVGNLPYYITTLIVKFLINQNLNINKMVFMVQDEVADRFSSESNSKDYSSITLYLKYYFNVQKLFKVSKYSFYPVPKVNSAVLSFKKRVDTPKVDKDKYFKLINDSFKMKRKTLKNNLNSYDFSKIKNVLDKYNLEETIRAEELDEKVFIDISNSL